MKKLLEIIPSNTSSALGWTLIHSIGQGIAIVLIFSILRYVFKTSNTRYWLGIGALSLQFLAAIITFFAIFEPATTQTFSSGNAAFTNFLVQTSNLTFTPQKLSFLQQIEFFLQNNLDVFVTFWMIGTSLLLLRLVIGFSYVQGLKVQQVKPISADIQALMDNLLEKIQISAPIKLLESARATVPMTIGWLKPIILLPVGIATGLTVKQLEAILAHELAHIKRYDYLVNIFQNVVEILFFFHPATWFISAKVRDERENCCDDFAVEICGDRMVLAKALTQVASYQQQPRLAMAFGAKRQTFMDRIKRIIGINASQPNSYGNWTAVLGMILVVALGVVYGQKELAKNDKKTNKIEHFDTKTDEKKLDFYFFEMNDKNVGVYKNNEGKIEKILVEGYEIKGKVFDKMETEIESFLKKEGAKFAFVKEVSKDEEFGVFTQFFNKNALSDSTSLEEVEAEMERLGKEMEKYGKEMEKYGSIMESKYGREMEKQGAEMGQVFKKMEVSQSKMQGISIETQEVNLAIQKLELKYRDGKMPIDVEQKLKNLKNEERELEKKMHAYEAEIQKIDAELQPLDKKMNSLQSPMDSLSRLMERYNKPMDSLGKIMEEKGRILEKLAKEDEIRFKKEMKDFADFLMNENLIKDKTDFEIRLKGDKMLIDLQPQPANVYDKVYNWLNTHWSKRVNLKEKDFEIRVKGDHININSHNGRGNFHYSTGFNSPPLPAIAPTPRIGRTPMPALAPMPPTPRRIYGTPMPALAPVAPMPRIYGTPMPTLAPKAPIRIKNTLIPNTYDNWNYSFASNGDSKIALKKPPKIVKVQSLGKDAKISKEMILDNKGTCTIYVVSQKNGKTFVKALPAILTNDNWTAKGLKAGDLIVIETKQKLKDGDEVVISGEPKIGQVWLTPEQRGQAVMGNEDPELERNEEGKNTSIYANPLLLNGQPFDYATFSIKSKGVLSVMKGKPTSPEAVKIPFRLYLRRNGMIVYEKKSTSKLTQVEVSEILAFSKAGDQIIINPTEKVDFKAKRIINILL